MSTADISVDPAQEFRVTFGVQYAQDEHPRWAQAHPDGWLTILADDEEDARRAAFALLGRGWCAIEPGDSEYKDWDRHFPRGELARVDVRLPR